MAKWNPNQLKEIESGMKEEYKRMPNEDKSSVVYADSVSEINFLKLQKNLQNCLEIVE